MRIAQIAPCWINVPPDRYGGIEYMISVLTDGLVDRGHDVTLFATAESKTKAKLRALNKGPLGILTAADALLELPHLIAAYSEPDKFDLIHDHTFLGMGIAIGAQIKRIPVVNTLHVPVSRPPFLRETYELLSERIHLIAPSDAQRANLPALRYAATIHHGIPVSRFPYRAVKDDFLLFVGRMSPEKGPHLAIEAANALGARLLMGFKLTTPKEQEYYKTSIKPLLSPNIELLGELDFEQKTDLFSRARCTLMPVQWPEPFGLVAVESLACGTPVVAWRNGALPEIIEDGVSGILVDSLQALIAGIQRVEEINPAACRARAQTAFSAEVMIDAYEAVYWSLGRR